MNNRKGFSLVELLAVVVILGILASVTIFAVSRVIDKSKNEKNITEVKSATLAAKSYLQANKELAPKGIGESIKIPFQELKDTKYLTEDIIRDDGKNCMENSFIEVIKTGKNSYDYKPHVYCGSEVPPIEDALDPPVLKNGIIFSDSNDVGVASFSFTILGSATNKNTEITSYTYVISTKRDAQTDYQEVYNSGVLNGENRTEINVSEKIKKYIDLTGITSVRLTVLARNTTGGSLDEHAETGTGIYADYQDTIPPYCEDNSANLLKFTQAKPGEWYNRAAYEKAGRGKSIQIKCSDGDGSQCLREIFTQTWPNNQTVNGTQPYLYGAKYAWIYIKDNAGNDGPVKDSLPDDWNDAGDANHRRDETGDYRCLVRVNVDILEPEVNVTVKAKAGDNEPVVASKTVGGLDANGNRRNNSGTIDFNTYKIDSGADGNKWFNGSNSPDGPVIHVTTKDNIELASWTWETNVSGVKSKTTYTADEKKVSDANDDSDLGDFKTPTNKFIDDNTYSIDIGLPTDGVRWGKLTVYDRAGNKTVVNINAYVDKTPPNVRRLTVNTSYLQKNDIRAQNGNDYSPATWTNKYVKAYIANNFKNDNVSGFYKGKYNVYDLNGKLLVNEASDTNKNEYYGDKDQTAFVFSKDYQGKDKIEFALCDNANNCSGYIAHKPEIWLDTVAPKCTVERTMNHEKGAEGDGEFSTSDWAGKGETVVVTATCDDVKKEGILSISECSSKVFSHEYKDDINISNGGAAGAGKGGSFTDNAGNTVNCAATKDIKIDHKAPDCTTKVTYSGGDRKTHNNTEDGWLMKGETATVTATCNDKAQKSVVSGCHEEYKTLSKLYDFEIVTTTAGAAGKDEGGTVKDNADNTTKCPANRIVKIDYTKPTCSTTKAEYNSSGQPTTPSNTWLKKGDYVVVTSKCSDKDGGSTCASKTKSHKYTTTTSINISNGGPNGAGVAYTFKDVAGNVSDACPNNQVVKIDAVLPKCSYVNCSITSWTNNKNLKLTYGGTDNESGIADDSAKGEIALNTARKTTSVKAFTIKDKAGNENSCDAKTCNTPVDPEPPTPLCGISGSSMSDTGSHDKINNVEYSGISARYYMATTVDYSNPNDIAWSNGWSSSSALNTACGGTTYYNYMLVIDKAGNRSVAKCGNNTTQSCCGENNPKGCVWKTACRAGMTAIYNSSYKDDSTFVGTIYHSLGGRNDRVYVISEDTSWYYGDLYGYVETPYQCWNGSCHWVHIYRNCIGGYNTVCPYSTCPG